MYIWNKWVFIYWSICKNKEARGTTAGPQLQVSHNFAMWLLAAIKQKKKSFCWIFISFKALKIFLSFKKKGGKGTIEFSKKFTQLFNQQNAIALFFMFFSNEEKNSFKWRKNYSKSVFRWALKYSKLTFILQRTRVFYSFGKITWMHFLILTCAMVQKNF